MTKNLKLIATAMKLKTHYNSINYFRRLWLISIAIILSKTFKMYFLLNWSFFAIFKQTFCFLSSYCITLERILCWDLTIRRTLKKMFFVFLPIATFFFALVISDKWVFYTYESTCSAPSLSQTLEKHIVRRHAHYTGEIWKRTSRCYGCAYQPHWSVRKTLLKPEEFEISV